MKNISIQLLLGLALVTQLVSCDVDRYPENTVNDANFWNSAEDVRLVANYFYTTLPGLATADVEMDNWGVDGYQNDKGNPTSDGSRIAPATSTDYDYSNIYQANKLIEKASEVIAKGAEEKVVNWYVAEARFFRAWYYFEMFKRFGGVPIITKTMGVSDPDIFKARATREEVLQLIYDDLDYAIATLRSADQLSSAKDYGRISRTAALAFKSRVGLFEGTRAKFHGYGDAKKHLTIAKDAAQQVIESKEHAIFSTPVKDGNGKVNNEAYYNLFQEAGEGRANKENIIVKQYGVNLENSILITPIQRYYEGGNIGATQNFVDNYLMIDGLPVQKSSYYIAPNAQMKHVEYFSKRDPRMSFTLFKAGDEFKGSGKYSIPNATLQRTGFNIRKYASAQSFDVQRSYIDRPVLRYAEVLLNYAEAVYELDGVITDEQLNATINVLRKRLPEVNVGTLEAPKYTSMPSLSNAFVNDNGLKMQNEIRRERRVELAYEGGMGYWDLIRWKTAEHEMIKPLLGSYFFSEYSTANWSDKTPVNTDKYIVLQPANLRKFDPEKDYLWPLPTNEIAKNKDVLTQNPKW
ncbi:RagB/SusD family nutrient uptake outer membrane protein [Sphingobacterium yanglingense]|uniref:Putative outer membrane starch-binding protein n=1 Tax=Sphingobacterium yanglingense TaxID=1437280 RepID=A0A4R6W6K3_9SPHI|nr:RagB/SusD family nutrient uptake outer membrane protein [Sphingobacterium yanglingense]TDQ72288.1 putative outer membrane starch-binding protein [Sphingobacterium yanglingense]